MGHELLWRTNHVPHSPGLPGMEEQRRPRVRRLPHVQVGLALAFVLSRSEPPYFVLCRTGFRAKDLPEIERALLGHAEFTELKVSGAHITRRWLEAAIKYSD